MVIDELPRYWLAAILLYWAAITVVFTIYVACGFSLHLYRENRGRLPKGRRHGVWKATKWPALLFVVTHPILDFVFSREPPDHWDAIHWGWSAVCWWVCRDAGDDDLKKWLKKKLKDTVQRVGGKLVIVPATAQ